MSFKILSRSKRLLLLIMQILSITLLLNMSTNAQSKLPSRDEIADKYKWNLTDIFSSPEQWQKEYDAISADMMKIKDFKGKISKSAKDLYECVIFINKLDQRFSKLAIYTSLGKDLDLNDAKFKQMSDKIQKLGSEYASVEAFFSPEMMKISDKQMEEFYKSEPKLKEYRQKFDVLFRTRKHTLTEEQEKLLADLSPIFEIPTNTYSILKDAELPFPTIKDPDGHDVQVSHGRYRAGLYSQDRTYRKNIYMGVYEPFNQLKSTFAELFNGRVNIRITNAKIRNYSSAVEAALYPNNIPVSVYETLIKVVNENLKVQHRWASIKKKVLKVDELHPYDTYVSLFPAVTKTYTYDEAVEICKKALEPLGKEYLDAMNFGFENRWIDVYETKAKRSGAYSNSSGSGPHPFILLNWNNTIDDMFTLIHELGHNMHSFFTEKTQPFQYRDYATFVAEVASTANEALLFEYLLKNAQTKEEKLALYEKFLTNLQTTFFRQTEFAEFEKMVHERAEKGEVLSADQLTDEFVKSYQKYWGPEMVVDREEGYTWARVPHLMDYNFYVYQYATSFAASFALMNNVKSEGKPAIDRFLTFLSSGSSDYPIEILKKAGVDMTKEETLLAVIHKANQYLDELEKMIK